MFIKRLGININEEKFSAEFKQKNIQFFKGLDNDDAVVYYATASDSYYDLVTVRRRNDVFNSVPAPLFIEWTGIHPENIPGVEVIDREELEAIIDEIVEEREKEKAKAETEEFIANMAMNSKVGQIIRDLTNGETLVIDTVTNQYGDEVPDTELYLNDGLFEISRINCYSSRTYGLGTCNCITHPASKSSWITPETALEYIKKYIEAQEKIEAEKENERQIIAMWLAQATSND
jgi:hypothetical protein